MSGQGDASETARIELHAEDLAVGTRRIETGRVRVELRTETVDRAVEVPLASERVEIERVAIGRVVQAVPEIRQEGDVTIYPVMEEVLVTERRLMLREEVRVRRIRTVAMHRETVRLSHQVVDVTRSGLAKGEAAPAQAGSPDVNYPDNNGEHP